MSNLVKVYDPKGQVFEVTNLNAHDLVRHNKWTYEPPVKVEAAPVPEKDTEAAVEEHAKKLEEARELIAEKKRVAAEKRAAKKAAEAKALLTEDAVEEDVAEESE